MEINQVDLHIHTTCSDGQYSVDEILEMSKQKGLRVIGIVDHDTAKHFEVLAKSRLAVDMLLEGYRIFAGIEFSCKIGNLRIHLIGYSINYKDDTIVRLIEKATKFREQKLEYFLDRLAKVNIKFTESQIQELKKTANVGRSQLAMYMVEIGVVNSVEEAFSNFLMEDDQVNSYKLEARDVIDAVHSVGGFVVIAHPYQIMTDNKLSIDDTVRVWDTLIELGADGMECYYSKYKPVQIKTLLNYAETKKLSVTMGSDFHGEKVKPNIKLGQIKAL